MSLALNAAPFLRDETIIENKPKPSTEDIKKRLRKKVEKKTVSFELNDDDDSNDLVDFKPVNSELSKTDELISNFPKNNNEDGFAYENIGFFQKIITRKK